MTTFDDGPAKGQHLMLKRAARFLRVTEEKGKWDALDQLGDTPKPAETLYAYEIFGEIGTCHICAKGGAGGFYPLATYRYVGDQPSDETMRDATLWHEWCLKQVGGRNEL